MNSLHNEIQALGKLLCARKEHIATAESCTGGLISSTLTDCPGSSDWFLGALVAYSNEIKNALLKVSAETLQQHGAVSEQTVRAMAAGACSLLGVDHAVAVSGVAGPGGGSPQKPVGTVWIGWSVAGELSAHCFHFDGSRSEVKQQTVEQAIRGLSSRIAAL